MLFPLISDTYQFILFWNGKCACTSLKHWFGTIHNTTVDTWAQISWLGEDRSVIPYRSMEQKQEFLDNLNTTYKHYKKYIVVRNPAERLASAYICDIAYRTNKTKIPNPTFEEYVEYFYQHPECIDDDAHTARQSAFIENIQFDRIIHMKIMKEEFEILCKEHNISPVKTPERIHSLTVKRNTSLYDGQLLYKLKMNQFALSANFSRIYAQNRAVCIPGYDGFFNEEIIQKIREMYATDYDLLYK